MKNIAAIILTLVLCGCSSEHGVRRTTKNMNDDLTWFNSGGLFPPIRYTIRELTEQMRPEVHDTSARVPEEKFLVEVGGVVQSIREEGDGDMHLTLKDDDDNTIVAELPSARAVNDPHVQHLVQAVRAWIDQEHPKNKHVVVIGVRFYDSRHSSDHTVEIHPLLGIRFARQSRAPD